MTREEWLVNATDLMRPWFAELDFPLPKQIRVSCGFTTRPRRALGQCWADWVSRDNYFEIFITPVLDDTVEVLAVHVHELCHTGAGIAAGHKGPFKRLALAIGLEGPMRSTTAGAELRERLNDLSIQLGPYPHAELNPFARGPRKPDGKRPQPDGTPQKATPEPQLELGSRLKKILCPSCGYIARTSRKWIAVGLPTCPCGTQMVVDDPSVNTSDSGDRRTA